MSAVNWTAAKNAIHAWIVGSLALPAERVLFGGQNAIRPRGVDTAWVSVWIMGDEGTDYGFTRYVDNPTPSAGAEIIKEVHSSKLVTMQITCYGPKNATDETEAYAMMSTLVAETDLSEVREPLADGGVNIQQFSAVTTIGGIINTTRIEPRSSVTVQFLTPSLVSRAMTFIEHVNVEVEVTSPLPVKVFDYSFDLGD